MLSKQEAKDSAWPIARGTGVGAATGLIPGVGSIVPAVIAYVIEKRWSKNKHKFGTGAIEGVASPEDITLIDLGNEPGTMVNGARVNKCKITPGDQLQIGGTKIVLDGAFHLNNERPGTSVAT